MILSCFDVEHGVSCSGVWPFVAADSDSADQHLFTRLAVVLHRSRLILQISRLTLQSYSED